jgi:hypothetical protein
MDSIVLMSLLFVFAYIVLYIRGRYYLREGYTNVHTQYYRPTNDNWSKNSL